MKVSSFFIFMALFVITGHARTATDVSKMPWPDQPVMVSMPAMLEVIAPNAQLEQLAQGFRWAEGPVAEPVTGDILFSDVPTNTVYRWRESDGLSVYLKPSGYTGLYPDNNLQEGANGLMFNANQQLVLAQHGDRRLAMLQEASSAIPKYVTLASHYQDKLFNSPNDVVQHSGGDYYFTDPPYGLKDADQSAQKQQDANGIYRVNAAGQVTLLASNLTRPNGLAFSPDERWLYVANSDPASATWWRYPVLADGTLGDAKLFFDATATAKTAAGLPDGLKVLPSGIVLATGPGGVWVFTPEAEHLGTILTGVPAANVALSQDASWLYITASQFLLRIKLSQ